MGILLEGSENIFVDNESVGKPSINPGACLKKKYISIVYQKSR